VGKASDGVPVKVDRVCEPQTDKGGGSYACANFLAST
jgi:hypothetical protein